MSFQDLYRLSSHAVIFDKDNRVLLLKQNYGDGRWGLPGGSLEKGETVHDALIRECYEEIGIKVKIEYLSGIYYHSEFNSHVFIFKCNDINENIIKLSNEHSEYKYVEINELNEVQRERIEDCKKYKGVVKSKSF